MSEQFKIPQYNVYKFSTFKFFTDEENELYNKYQSKSKLDEKEKAKEELINKIRSYSGIREIKEKYLYYQNQVSWFANDLINLFVDKNTKERSVVDDIIIIKIHHENIFEQIMDNGFYCGKKRYSFYTAGAGQQRKDCLTFVSEEALEKHNLYLMGGLTDENINTNGGVNTGKMLAYKALTMSAGIEIDIPLDNIIVVEDFETLIEKKVEFIDTKDPSLPITRDIKKVPVNHMDGAGMVLPNKIAGINGNCQFRNKWMKGALVEFDFLTFAKEVAGNTIVTDIYNDTYDVEKDDIYIILTHSQFKMSDHYKDWKSFKDEMKNIDSKFYICNIENPPQEMKELSYQYLQTLDIPVDDEDTIARLCQPTLDYIRELHKDKDEALKALGATEENEGLKPLQEALLIYPELLQDKHVKNQIKGVVKSYRNNAKGGRILSQGFYSYIFPDIYAFCERLFMGTKEPKGIIPENHVYNAFYKETDINLVDLMRSPHLHPSEHCVRKLTKEEKCNEWFRGNATYVSIHDLAQLQMKNDVDGDICYISSNMDLINHIRKDCLPIYYEMPKAPKQIINKENIKGTLKKAFEANMISEISNALTKYLNQAYDEGFKLDMDFIARLQAWNNFTIDFPKTGKNIELPENDMALFESLQYPNTKSPHFFRWAKNKNETAVAGYGNGVVDRISKYIKDNVGSDRYAYFDKSIFFNYAMLASSIDIDRSSNLYAELQNLLFKAEKEIKRLNAKLSEIKREESEVREFASKFDVTYQYYRDKMIELFKGDTQICVNTLIDIEYCQTYRDGKSKNILWNCFGKEILNNIKKNIDSDREIKSRARFAYKKDKQHMQNLHKRLEEKSKHLSVDITKGEYEKINSIKNQDEKYLYFVLMCLSKISKDGKIKIYKNTKSNRNRRKLNINYLNDLAQIKNVKNGYTIIKKFKEEKIINSVKNKCDIITLPCSDSNNDDICFNVKNVWRPLVSLAQHEGKVIDQCVICSDDFIKKGKTKTCSKNCSIELERRNKKNNYKKSAKVLDIKV